MSSRILISRLSALGDVVHTLPVAGALKAGIPGCHITWVVDPRFAGIVECCSMVDERIVVKPKLHPSTWPRIAGEFDIALDMQGLFKSAITVARAKAPVKLGYHWQRELAWLFTSRVIPDPTSFHVVDQYVDVARAAGGVADRAEFHLKAKPEDLESVKAKLAGVGVAGGYVVINPGAGWATKRWPPRHFAKLIDRLHASTARRAVLIGGKGKVEEEGAREVISLCAEPPASLVGQTSVRELVALMANCDAHVGGDTGSTHIAAALDKPAIGLYSITRPQRSCPYGQVDRCHYHPDGLSYIEPEPVYETLAGCLR